MNINVRLVDLDTCFHECVVPNADGSYTILINARCSYEKQNELYLHALSHIYNGDFEKANADQIEYKAHGIA